MRSLPLLCFAVLPACSLANPYNRRDYNSSSISGSGYKTSSTEISSSIQSSTSSEVSSSIQSSTSSEVSSSIQSSTSSSKVSSPIQSSTSSAETSSSIQSSSTSSPADTITRAQFSSRLYSIPSYPTFKPPVSSTSLLNASTTEQPRTSTFIPTFTPTLSNSTHSTRTPSANASATGPCTGCVLQALDRTTTWLADDWTATWDSIVVTETVVTQHWSYFDGDVFVSETINLTTSSQTLTVGDFPNATNLFSTPIFTVTPTDGVELELPAGPTYVIFRSLYGGLDFLPPRTGKPTQALPTKAPEPTCGADMRMLTDLKPTGPEGWSHFIATISEGSNGYPERELPPALVDYLNQDPDAQKYFSGSDLVTCTSRPYEEPGRSYGPAPYPSPSPEPPFFTTPGTSTYISPTNIYTSSHITVQGPIRNDPPGPSYTANDPPPNNDPQTQKPENNPQPLIKTNDVPPVVSIIPKPNNNNNDQSITIGDSVYPIHPAKPTEPAQPNQPIQPQQSYNPYQPNQQNNPTPGVVIGSETLTPGQTTTINGVPIVVPTAAGGTRVVVGDSTVAVNPAPTGPSVLTVGDSTVTANPQGQFVVGSQTLTPGGPAITVDGSTLSVGPSGSVAVVNGVTQTLGNAPLITAAPVLTMGGKTISATVIGGTTEYVLGSDRTLTPGGVLTLDGTTYSMPKKGSGSTVVVNGVTSTLSNPELPVLTLGYQTSITATVKDGTTAFVLGSGKTLTPGGVITVSGTTYSMPQDGSGSTIVVNGVTSSLNALPVLTIGEQSSITATIEGGTTAFILGPDQTLTPGGVLTISGTTYSLPASASGSVIVINGVTSTLGQGPITAAPDLTIDGKTYSATVRDGTTEYVLGTGTTLKPGEAITISGTTYSLDKDGTALVINGKTSTIPKSPASNSATTTDSASRSESTDSSTTSHRDPGNFIASGIGISSTGGAALPSGGGLDKWVESGLIGLAGWIVVFV